MRFHAIDAHRDAGQTGLIDLVDQSNVASSFAISSSGLSLLAVSERASSQKDADGTHGRLLH
jgi:hypothetical protein